MKKPKKVKLTKEELVNHLIQKELDYVGKTIDEIRDDDEWYRNNTLTTEQYEEWKTYAKKLIKEQLKCTSQKVDYEFAMFDLMYGLKVIENDNNK